MGNYFVTLELNPHNDSKFQIEETVLVKATKLVTTTTRFGAGKSSVLVG